MTWVLPNTAIKMQHRSCVLSVSQILSPALSCTHIPWCDNTGCWAGSSSILLEVLVLTKFGTEGNLSRLCSGVQSVPSVHRQLEETLPCTALVEGQQLVHPLSVQRLQEGAVLDTFLQVSTGSALPVCAQGSVCNPRITSQICAALL